MANIIQGMEIDAQTYMNKRKKVEERRKKDMLENNQKMFQEISKTIALAGSISVSNIPSFVNTELKPIVDKYRFLQAGYVDSFIRDDYQVGIEQAQRFLTLSKEEIPQVNKEISDSEYEEVLVALLLYGERITDGLHSDLINYLVKDMTSIYITNKNIRSYESEKEIDTDDFSTINTILAGSIINKYINPTFKNINNRTDMTAKNESNRALNHGLMMRYIMAKRDGLTGLKVKWVEIRDERLCKYCREAANGGEHGNGVYDVNDVNPPPLHSRCRCILIPFLSRWEEME